jgi:peptidoglycan/xylan/chitin deacetylase (PgdA/CDA1 family)
MRRQLTFLCLVILLLSTGCSITFGKAKRPTATATAALSAYQNQPAASATIQPTSTRLFTPLATAIQATPTPTLVAIGVDEKVTVPILLYHHVAEKNEEEIRYTITIEQFKLQMETLKKLGYTSIPMSQLVQVINEGGYLPARPVVITFDDGDEDVYQNAFPIMRDLGMTGIIYLVGNRMDAEGFINVEEMRTLAQAGWEAGSHSATHVNLLNNVMLSKEMYEARSKLSDTLGLPVESFAYPFGGADEFIMRKAKTYGYRSAVGLGKGYIHSKEDLFFLSRLEVQRSTTLEQFINLLPWKTGF